MGNTRHSIEGGQSSSFEHSKLLYVSTSKYEGDWQSILHSHPFSELFYVVNGNGSFIAEGSEFPVSKNDMVIINPHVQHTEKSLHTTPLEYIVLGIDGLSFSSTSIASAQDVLSMQTASGTVYKYNMTNSNVYAYLNIMLEENYLDANYSENITLDTLASITHMNKYYMAHAFTKYIGVSPINYLLQKRIQEGKSLLESTSYSIAQISTTLGFSSQSYFSQTFKKATGKTPIQHRNEFRKEK